MSNFCKFFVEFSSKIANGKLVCNDDKDVDINGLCLIGESPYVHGDLYYTDWSDVVNNDDNAPTTKGTYHVYIIGHYWWEEINNSSGSKFDLEFEIDSVEYFDLGY